MKTLKQYDRVVLVRDLEIYELLKGEEGMVMGYDKEQDLYAIQFPFDDEQYFHKCKGLVPNGRGIFLTTDELELV